MSSIYQVGSLCEDCLRYGLENYLKTFYINLDEQIIKCESSSCMFPYLSKPVMTDLSNSKPLENTICLDDFIEQSLKEINETPVKPDNQKSTPTLNLDASDMYDFSAIFMNHPIKTEVKEKPLMFQIVKQEPNVQPVVLESKAIKNTWNTQVSKPNATANLKQLPQKSRITRCLSGVKSTPRSLNVKKTRIFGEKIEPVLVIEPHSGKSMRPLDLIKRYVKNK